MDFYHQSISANRNCGARERSYFVSLPGSVAGINDDWQVAQPLYCWNYAQVQRIARVIGKRPHAPFAQNHVVITFTHYIFGGHQKFLKRRGHPRFTITGFLHRPARFSKEKFCILRAPIWTTSAYCSTSSSDSLSIASVMILMPHLSRTSAMICSPSSPSP